MPFKKGNQFGGRRPRKSGATSTQTRRVDDDASDDEMIDGDGEGDAMRDGTPQEDEVEEDAATPAQDDDEEDDEDAPPTITTLPRRRGGRARGSSRRNTRGERLDYGTPQPLDADEGSESGTPFRRRRGRPEGSGRPRGRAGGFRGRRKGQKAEPPAVVTDKNGQVLDVLDDEVQVDDDPEGNTKVDEKGNLQGGREYRVRTFKILGKDDRLYMLSTEPARCCGFRDSYLFFTKHPKLYKVVVGEEEKKDLIDRDILPNSYKGRTIGVVTARSVFREFGARIIVGGRKVIDDYRVAEARANGAIEGELADPDDRLPDNRDDYNRNRYVAWFGASEVYRTQGQGTQPTGKPGPMGKRRTNITVQNWQHAHAREASRFNSALAAVRRSTLDGVYDTHTNMMYYPKIMQPTHARWEHVPPPPEVSGPKPLVNGLTNGHNLTNGTTEHSDHDVAMDVEEIPRSQEVPQSTIFSDVPAVISRNFAVIDTHYKAPPISNAGYPGPDGNVADPTSGPNGFSSIPDDLIDELPEDCRRALEVAKRSENQWKKQWGTEAQSALRQGLKIGFSGYPV
ncbi:hypothetical protein LTR85_012027 [Meristemomyces frigidus]|nr:hypothetical protein LTR85_012027 [Meristemomyces frigidus]